MIWIDLFVNKSNNPIEMPKIVELSQIFTTRKTP